MLSKFNRRGPITPITLVSGSVSPSDSSANRSIFFPKHRGGDCGRGVGGGVVKLSIFKFLQKKNHDLEPKWLR
jgi:hypothetical protein